MECRSGDGDRSLQSKATSRLRRYKELTVLYALWGGIFTNSYPEPLAPSDTTWGDCLILDFHDTGFTAKMFRYCRRVITDKWCISARSWRSLPNMPCGLRVSGFCRGVSRGTLLVNTHGGTLYLHREVSVFIYARQGQDTFPATIFLF